MNHWHILKEKLVKAYLRSLEQSKPRMSCTFLVKQEACKKCPAMQTSNVVVYYTDLHVAEHIQHCKYLFLPEAMMSLHVFPASTKNPRQDFHFGLFDFIYLTKMIGYLSNHSWAKFVPVTKKSLNKAYMLYRRLAVYAKSSVRERHGIKEATCAVCENAQKNYVTMDGNFQLKRYKGVANKPNGQKLPGLYDKEAEGKLWGSHEEVEAQSGHTIQKEPKRSVIWKPWRTTSRLCPLDTRRTPFSTRMGCLPWAVPVMESRYGSLTSKLAKTTNMHWLLSGLDWPKQTIPKCTLCTILLAFGPKNWRASIRIHNSILLYPYSIPLLTKCIARLNIFLALY
ncbi:unnamed protein product [Rhizopus stolonifer]